MRSLVGLTLLTGLIVYFWHSLPLLPLKLLVVFFHESAHALATVLTGGEVKSLQIVPAQGGRVISAGGVRWFILSAGYLGSLLCGVTLFLVTVATDKDRWVTGVLGVLLIVLSIVFAGDLFSRLFGIGSGGVLFLAAWYLPAAANDFIARAIALTNLLYVPLDIYDDTLRRGYLPSDAAMLADEYGGTVWLWGGLWLILSILLIIFCLKLAVRMETAKRKHNARSSLSVTRHPR